jgi:hypothetical protein
VDWTWRNRVLGAIAFVALLVIAFVIGALVHGTEPSHAKAREPGTTTTPAATPQQPHSDIQLVPSGSGVTPGEQPVTSAPVTSKDGSMANPYARDDATALPQSDYTQLAKRAQTQGQPSSPQLVDPRSITGSVDGAAPRHTRSASMETMTSRAARTEPVAVYQPVPPIHVGDATARLLLTVGADGLVKDIDIAKPLPGDTARLIGAVQEWRFRPATENGVPVASRFSVDITFHGNEQ